MTLSELGELDACGQAALVQAGQVTPAELIEAGIERLSAADERLNIVVTALHEEALVAPPPSDVPLPGVPMLVKDFLATIAGVPQMAGSRFVEGYTPSRTSRLVERFREAGLVVLGTSNLAEFALLSSCEPLRFGPTLNPWDLARSPGGSSGGAAAAVASGAVPVAHGNDSGGSIRIPSSDCGLFGLKPSRARNSMAPDYGDMAAGLWAEHVLTRSVRDSAAVLDATHGPAPGDPYWPADVGSGTFSEAAAGPSRPLRIALTTTRLDGSPLHPECRRAAESTAALVEELGHAVAEARPSFDRAAAGNAFMMLIADGVAWTTERFAEILGRAPGPDDLEPLTWRFLEQGRARSSADHLRDVETVQLASRAIGSLFDEYDAWLTPTMGLPPRPIGFMSGEDPDLDAVLARDDEMSPFVWIANITGQPAMSVPLHWSEDELPIGSHFVGRRGDERGLLALASELERAHPWAGRWPPA